MAVLKQLVRARAELAGLNESLVSLPNPQVFVHSLALLEAQASSEIENIVTTTDELFRAETLVDEATPATREALRYRTAIFRGLEQMRQRRGLLTANGAAQVCTEIRGVETDVRKGTGTFIGNPVTRERIYTPPEGEQVIREKLANWEGFVNEHSSMDPLIRMAAAHYQFEAIHPFDDGNGRTGRILNVLQLMASGLLDQPILYVSRNIIEHKNQYYRLLNDVTAEGAWEPWTLFMIEAVRATAESTKRKIKDIQGLQATVRGDIHDRLGSHVPVEFAEVLFDQPYLRIRDVRERCDVARPTATKYLAAMVDAGVLSEEPSGREKLFVNTGLMKILRGS